MESTVSKNVASGGTDGKTACVCSSVTRPPVMDAVLALAPSGQPTARSAACTQGQWTAREKRIAMRRHVDMHSHCHSATATHKRDTRNEWGKTERTDRKGIKSKEVNEKVASRSGRFDPVKYR